MTNRYGVTSKEANYRSITKALTYRSTILISDATVISFITSDTSSTLGIIAFTNSASTLLYFVHERLWNKITWGVHSHPDKYNGRLHERTYRTVTKSITYRLLGMVSDTFIVSSLTMHAEKTLWIILFTNLTSTILYFIHERVWNNYHWGKQPETADNIPEGTLI